MAPGSILVWSQNAKSFEAKNTDLAMKPFMEVGSQKGQLKKKSKERIPSCNPKGVILSIFSIYSTKCIFENLKKCVCASD